MFLGSAVRAARRRLERLERTPRPPRRVLPFGLDWVKAFLPHYAEQPFSPLHRELADDLAALPGSRRTFLNRIAPRGSAKSTIASKAYPLWSVLEGVEPFVLLLSDSSRQACSFLRAIKRELESNPHIAAAYPHAAGVGPIWQGTHVRTRNGCELMAIGAGGRVRGLSAGERRPTLVVVDDANDKQDAFSPDRRRKKLDWLTKDVLPIGEPDTNFVSVGTAIHRDAIVCALAREGGWQTKSYRSVIRWPDRADLWVRWERLYTNLADPDRAATARAFYEANRTDMDAGGVVLWPERFPLYDLMGRKATMGEAAFRCELQDEPGSDGAVEWDPLYFAGTDFWVPRLPADLVFKVQALDPSKGRADRPGDWQAHVLVGLGRDGNLYFDADLRREDSTRMAGRAADLADVWKPDILIAEDNGTCGLLAAEFAELVAAGRLAAVRLEMMTSTDPKSERIRKVGAYLARRQARVVGSTGGRMLVDQWMDWPGCEFDDAADAAGVGVRRIEMAYAGN